MSKTENVNEFLSEKALAIVGVSRSGNKMGNGILKDLNTKGYNLYPVHPSANEINGVKCYPDFNSLPEKVGGVIISVPPKETEKIVRQVEQSGIKKIWMQNGAESQEAIDFCLEKEITVVHHKCILMFAEPTAFFHKMHRWIWNITSVN